MDGKVFGLGRPIITVVQPTQSIMGKHATRGYAANSAPRRSLAQPKVRAVFVMVGDVLGKQPLQVPLVERNHMVEQLAAAAPHPTLGDTILPGTFEGGRTARPVMFCGMGTTSPVLSRGQLHRSLCALGRYGWAGVES